MQDVINSVSFLYLLLYVGYSFPPWLFLILLQFFTRSVQLIFSMLFHHHISQLARYFQSTFRSVQV